MSPAAIEDEPLDAGVVKKILSSPPFVIVDGVINFRDFGSLDAPNAASPDGVPVQIKAGVLFRSGELTKLSASGKETLKQLGIRTVFDLRSDVEIKKYKSATPAVDGVRFVPVPVSDGDEYDPMMLAARAAKFEADPKDAFATLYSSILINGAPAYSVILKHIRDHPEEPCLIHCTAGKDRTGMFAAILQLLLGAKDEDIINDYYLTTVGLQPVLPYLVDRFQKEVIYRDNWQGFLKMASARKDTMQSSLQMIREKFGGADNYVKNYVSMTDDDIAQIRKNLLIPKS